MASYGITPTGKEEEMEEERVRSTSARGCIKTTRNPWKVKHRSRDGSVRVSLRRPSDEEREKNRLREKRRRMVAAKIFSSLKKEGNYSLPKHADQNDVLIALCGEAGWLVDGDGNITRKEKLKKTTRSKSSCTLSNSHDLLSLKTSHHQLQFPESATVVADEHNELNLSLTLGCSWLKEK